MAGSRPVSGPRRRGFSYRGLIIALVVVVALPAIAWAVFTQWSRSSQNDSGPIMHTVKPGEFIHDVTERGNVESASNVEIASKVKSSSGGGSGGTTILEIVDEGTIIKSEDCLPEGYLFTYEELKQLEEYREEQAGEDEPVSAEGSAGQPASPEPRQAETNPQDTNRAATAAQANDPNAGGAAAEPEDRAPRLTTEELSEKLILVKLDSSSLENQLIQQKILCENSRAAVIQAQNVLDTAVIAKKEFVGTGDEEAEDARDTEAKSEDAKVVEGSLKEKMLDFEIKISEAKVDLDQKLDYLAFSRKLARRGFITKKQLEVDETNVAKARNALKLLEVQRDVYWNLTKGKLLGQLKADIATAQAKLAAAEASHQLDLERLKDIEEQVVHCTIFATQPGQVVYANVASRWGNREVMIEAGEVVRENQVIIRLPDPTQMQVKANVNEAKISLVDVDMPVTIRLDAFQDVELKGVVEEVSAYPAPASWHRSDIKEYETIIEILDPQKDLPEGRSLRPGMTAEVKIRVEHLGAEPSQRVLLVPVQALIEHGQKYYCVLRDGRGFNKREVTIGSSNDKFVVIQKGLQEGEQVVLHASAYREKLDLPKLPPQKGPKTKAESQRPKRPNPAEEFKKRDKNGNGKLEADELDARMRPFISMVDTDKDGAVSRAEFNAALAKQRPGGRPKGPPPGPRP